MPRLPSPERKTTSEAFRDFLKDKAKRKIREKEDYDNECKLLADRVMWNLMKNNKTSMEIPNKDVEKTIKGFELLGFDTSQIKEDPNTKGLMIFPENGFT